MIMNRKEWQVKIKSLQQNRCEKPFTQVQENSQWIIALFTVNGLNFLPLTFLLFLTPLPPKKYTCGSLKIICIQTQQVLKI